MLNPAKEPESLLTTGEVAVLFHVTPKTVTRWAQAGKLATRRTLGGHRRFIESEVLRLLETSRGDGPHGEGGVKSTPQRG